MADSFRDGAGPTPLILLQKKRKLEEEPGEREGQDPVEGLVKPSTSVDPDLDISTSGSKSIQASNPDMLSSIFYFEEGEDDFGDDGTRATVSQKKSKLTGEKGLKSDSEPKLGEPEGEDLQPVEKITMYVPALAPGKKGSKSDSDQRLGEPEGEDLQGERDPSSCVTVLLPNLDMEGSNSSSKPKLDVEEIMRWGAMPRRLKKVKTRALQLEEEDEDDSPMSEEEWWNKWWESGDGVDYVEVPDSPGWGYSDLDEDDPDWHIKFREKYRRETPPKYRAILESDYCPPGVEKKDEALWERYLKQIEESEGYDITDFPGPTLVCPVTPVLCFKQCPSYVEAYNGYVHTAIKKFNSTIADEDDQYEVHDILTVNVSSRGCFSATHFMTFEAKKKNSIVSGAEDYAPMLTTFQARVFEDFATREVDVQECRIKGVKPCSA